MAITVGELALPITVPGLAEGLAAIDKLDAAAAAAGARKIDVGVSGTGVTAATAQVHALNTAAKTSSTQITASLRTTVAAVGTAARAEVAVVAQAARASETAVANSLRASLSRATSTSALMARLAATAPRASGGALGSIAAAGGGRAVAGATLSSLPGAAGSLGGALAGGPVALGIAAVAALGATVAGVSQLVSAAIPAVGDFNQSVRLLGATARLTGTPLSTLTATAGDLQRRLQITATNANGLTAAATRVTAAAGRTADTGRFLVAWMDLAARGLSTADAMALLSSNILENDDAANRLGLSNPSVIFEKWAASMGTTAARMTDTQKAAAMMSEVMTMGGRVAGEYEARMRGAEGAVERLDQAKQNFLITLGQAIVGGSGYSDLLSAQTAIVQRATTWVEAHRDEIGRWVVRLGDLVSGLGKVIDAMATLNRWLDRIDSLRPSGMLARVFGLAGGGGTSAPAFSAPTGPIDSAFGAALGMGGGSLAGFGSPFGTASALTTGNFTGTTTTTRRTGGGRTGGARGGGGGGGLLDMLTLPEGFGGLSNILAQGDRATPVVMPVRLRPLIINEPEALRALRARIGTFADGIGQAIAGSISAGFGAAFTKVFQGGGVMASIGAGFKALTGALLGGLGQAMVAFGQATVVAGGLMEVIKKTLMGFFGLGTVAAGVAMIAIGSALSAVASSAFGGMGSGGGGASFSAPSLSGDVSTRTTLTPRAAPVGGLPAPTGRTGTLETPRPVVVNATIIGPNDPSAQRAVKQLITNAERRGIQG